MIRLAETGVGGIDGVGLRRWLEGKRVPCRYAQGNTIVVSRRHACFFRPPDRFLIQPRLSIRTFGPRVRRRVARRALARRDQHAGSRRRLVPCRKSGDVHHLVAIADVGSIDEWPPDYPALDTYASCGHAVRRRMVAGASSVCPGPLPEMRLRSHRPARAEVPGVWHEV